MVVMGIQGQLGTTLMTISDLAAIDAEVKVAEADVLRIAIDQTASVTLEAIPGVAFSGRVVEIGASALPIAGTGAAAREFRVKVRLDNPDQRLRPGLTCDAEVLTAERQKVLVVPLQSVVVRPGTDGTERTGVFVADKAHGPVPACHDRPHRRPRHRSVGRRRGHPRRHGPVPGPARPARTARRCARGPPHDEARRRTPGQHRVPARLPRFLQPVGGALRRARGRPRRRRREPRHRRLHLRQGAPLRRAHVRVRSPAAAGLPPRPSGVRGVPVGRLGRGAGPRGRRDARGARPLGRGVGAALLLRGLQRPADAGHDRRQALQALRRLAAGAHAVRVHDGRGEPGAVRQDAVGHLRRLRAREAHRRLGREPVGVGHPPGAVHPRGAAGRGRARRRRPAGDAARPPGRSAPRAQARHGRRGRARGAPPSLRERPGRRGVPRGAHDGRRGAAGTRARVDLRARGRRGRAGAWRHRRARPHCTPRRRRR